MNIIVCEQSVHICCNEHDSSLDAFIDIFIGDENFPSLFKDIDDAEAFAQIITKLLDTIIQNGEDNESS